MSTETEKATETNKDIGDANTDNQAETTNYPSCRCGNTRDDVDKNPYVEAKGEWGAWGWFYLLIGITAVPKIVRFQCHQCHVVFDQTTDPKLLKQHI